MEQSQNQKQSWYAANGLNPERIDEWYMPNQPDQAGTGYFIPAAAVEPDERERKRRRRMWILSVSVCAALLALAVFSVIRSANTYKSIREAAWAAQSRAEESRSDVYEEDYRDYFARYYAVSNESAMERIEAEPGVTLSLYSREGLPELSLREIYERVNPAVVGVTMYRNGIEYGWGSGVIFTEDGYVIVNTHMVEGVDAATVTLSTGESYPALLVGADEQSDIAVLKIGAEGLPFACFGDSDELLVGDGVAAIGNPLGANYAGTMTNGIVSAINRSVTNGGRRMTLLQTNTAINEGSSGGALVNMCGQVVGITNMKIMTMYSATPVEGMCFAVPSAVVKEVADQLLASGSVSGEPTIGIVAGAVSAEAREVYGLPAGVYVTKVNEGSDAMAQGLREGDVITHVNGVPVASVADINAVKFEFSVGDSLTLTVSRDGEILELTVALVDKNDIRS